MKTIITTKYIAALLLLFFFCAGCQKEVLDRGPLDIYSSEGLWKDKGLVDAYVANLYSKAAFGGLFSGRGTDDLVAEVVTTDEARDGFGYDNYTNKWNKGLGDGTSAMIDYLPYNVIRSCNYFIENSTQSALDPAYIKNRVAEIRFIRAYTYFAMVSLYGGVPLITAVQQADDGDKLYVSRNTEDECYEFIVKECELAANDLPETVTGGDWGRATKYAALALKSKAALTAATISKYGTVEINGLVGIPLNKSAYYFQKSVDASNEIIDSKKYTLYNKYPTDKGLNYQSLFLEEGPSNPEIIFSKRFISQVAGHSFDWANERSGGAGNQIVILTEMINAYDNIDGSPGNIDFATAKGTLLNLFKNKDPRLNASVLYDGSYWKNDTLNYYREYYKEDGTLVGPNETYKNKPGVGSDYTQSFATGFRIKKFLDPTIAVASANVSGQDWIVFRLGEILLNRAEAAYELDPASATALEDINAIRDRAGIAKLTALTLEDIRHERRIECAFEGKRFYDLRRWRTAEQVLNNTFHSAFSVKDLRPGHEGNTYLVPAEGADGYKRVFLKKHYYQPFTSYHRNSNPNLVENPGY